MPTQADETVWTRQKHKLFNTTTHLEGPKMLHSPVVSLQKLVLMLTVKEGIRTYGEKSGIVTKFDYLLVTTMTCIFFIKGFYTIFEIK
jgi:hypothetical protein